MTHKEALKEEGHPAGKSVKAFLHVPDGSFPWNLGINLISLLRRPVKSDKLKKPRVLGLHASYLPLTSRIARVELPVSGQTRKRNIVPLVLWKGVSNLRPEEVETR